MTKRGYRKHLWSQMARMMNIDVCAHMYKYTYVWKHISTYTFKLVCFMRL